MLSAVDLFCGAGGMTLGLSKAGFRIVGAVDNWTPAVKTYSRNFSYPVILADVRAVSGEELRGFLGASSGRIDLLVGDPPCRGLSPHGSKSVEDGNTDLIFEFVRLVKSLRPRMFLMEYRPSGLLAKEGRLAGLFKTELTGDGYEFGYKLVNAADYGVPQVRKRLFYYGWAAGEVPEFLFPSPRHAEMFSTVKDFIGDLPSPAADRASSYDPLHYLIRTGKLNLERLRHMPPGGGVEDLPDELKPDYYRRKPYMGSYHGAYGRLHPDKPASTITGRFDSLTTGRFGHPFEDRNITLREGARLQTFPDDFTFEGAQDDVAAQIGNATPPLLATVIAGTLAAHLKGGQKSTQLPRRRVSSPSPAGGTVYAAAVQARLEFPAESERAAITRPAAPAPASQAGPFHSCFISYSSKDQELANRLSADLKAKGVRCWIAPHDLKIGDRFRDRIDESIRFHDKFLLILSEHSVASPWVEKEVETALEHESQNGYTVVFPVRLDDAVMKVATGWAADIRRARHIGDFSHWMQEDAYQEAFERLLRDLKA